VSDPVGGRLLFAGEATTPARFAFTDGAVLSGIREAKRLLQEPSIVIPDPRCTNPFELLCA
jgi:monoamine oxidase